MPWTPRRKTVVLIVVTTVIRLLWAASLELGNDEAYHTLYAVHPDWGYFDHPPMLMWVATLGKWAFGGWIHPLSLRSGFILLFAGSSWVMFQWTSRWFEETAGWYATLALNLSAYYTAAAGVFILPDGPFLFFALLTMQQLSEALFGPNQTTANWVRVGLACAGAMASKYHGVLLPMGTLLYVVVTPSAWRILRSPGPYVAVLLALLGLAPTLIWNYQHEWISVAFQGGRAVGATFSPIGLAIMIFGPIGYLMPWIWGPAVVALGTRLARFSTLEGIERFLVCLALVPLTLFGAVSCVRPILPHWPLIAFVALFPLIGSMWGANLMRIPVLVRRWIIVMSVSTLLLMGAFLLQARFGVLDLPWPSDPTREISGWESVGRELKARGILDRQNTFLFTERWYESGQLAFSVRNQLPVACYNQGDARGFAFWSQPQDWVGKDGIMVSARPSPNLGFYRLYFQSVDMIAEFSMTRGGKAFRPVQVFLCKNQQKPFPFTYDGRSRK